MAANKILETAISIKGILSDSVKKACDSACKNIAGIDTQTLKSAAKIAAGVAAIGGTVIAAGKMAYDLASEFDAAYDNIRIGTGATGEALDGLKEDFKAVYGSVPGSMEQAAQAIADYNTRLGLSGNTLQALSKQAILLSNNLGAGELGDIIKQSSVAFQAWNIDADQMAGKMDMVWKVSQSTGMGFNDILTNAQQCAPALQELGFDFDHAATLVGSLEKAGLNTNEVLAAMKKSVASFSKQGLSSAEGMAQYTQQIKAATTATEANNIAARIFGSKAGPTMAAAIRSGKMDISALTKELQNSTENIQALAWETMDGAERFDLLKQKAKLAVEPLAMAIFDLANSIMPPLLEVFSKLAPIITQVGTAAAPVFGLIGEYLGVAVTMAADLAAGIANNWGIIAPIVAGVAGALGAYKLAVLATSAVQGAADIALTAHNVILGITTTASGIATAATTALGAAFAFLTSPLGLIVLAIGAVIAIGVLLWQNWDTVKACAASLGEFLGGIWSSITDGCSAMAAGIAGFFSGAFNTVSGIINGFVSGALGAINSVIGAINGISISIPSWVPVFGGQSWSPNLPTFAAGGFTAGPSIAGEAGQEAIISFNPAYRAANIGYLAEAAARLGLANDTGALGIFGQALAGATGMELSQSSNSLTIDLGGIIYSPTVTVGPGTSKTDVLAALRENSGELLDMISELLESKGAGSYGNNGVF